MQPAALVAVLLVAALQPSAGFVGSCLGRPAVAVPQSSQSRVDAREADAAGDSWAPAEADEIPNDPNELQSLEQGYYKRAMERNNRKRQEDVDRLTKLRHNLRDLPKQRQCHRYRWTQTETTFDVEIPLLKACEDDELYLVVDKDQLQVALKTDESFGAITGVFQGDVDASSCSYRVHSRFNEPYIHLEIVKLTAPGMYEFWSELLQGEEESPTIRFKGKTPRYSWKQNAETIELEIPVPDDVTKRKTTLELDPAGDWMHLSFQNRPDFEPLEGKFKNLISPLDSVWMLDENENGKMLALTVKKRRAAHNKTSWWSGVLEGDDKWEPQQP